MRMTRVSRVIKTMMPMLRAIVKIMETIASMTTSMTTSPSLEMMNTLVTTRANGAEQTQKAGRRRRVRMR